MTRQAVVNLVQQAIQGRMSPHLVEEYVKAARIYGQQYNISHLVEDWIKEGRELCFSTIEDAQKWANTLP